MTKKLKLMSHFLELRGRAQVTNRRPAQQSATVYLMQLRAQTGAATLPRRRFMISVDLRKTQSLPHPVKINHVKATEPGQPPTASDAARLVVKDAQPRVPKVRPAFG